MKAKLTRICGEGEFKVEKVCCHEAFAAKPERRDCHIPWAHLEWLKLPRFDSDAKPGSPGLDPTQRHDGAAGAGVPRTGPEAERVQAAVARGNERAAQLPPETRMYCFR